MKLRAVVLAVGLSLVGAAVANCGSDGSSFDEGGRGDGGSSGNVPGFNTGEGGSSNNNGNNGCTKLTCADLKINCGPAGDGCGGLIETCGTCSGLETCGGGGALSICGGTSACIKKTCADLGFTCGPAGDGCGGLLQCGECTAPERCGGGGPSKCGGGQVAPDGGVLLPDGGACVGKTSCNTGECGFVDNGCGNVISCAGCPSGQTCGAGGPSMCGAPTCTPTTCQAQGATCGFIADGCGGSLNCGGTAACAPPQFCGGGGPNKCGAGNVDGGSGCVNFCLNQQTCTPTTRTTLTGTVFAPNGTLPIPGARIFVPNGATTHPFGVPDITAGVASGSCDQCTGQGNTVSLVDTVSRADGTFTLENVPAGVAFPIVIQLGKWRRLVTIPATTACTTRTLTAAQTRLPTRQAEGNDRDNIPFIAVSTGNFDGLECVFRKLGITSSGTNNQFGNPPGTSSADRGRIRIYRDNDRNLPTGNDPAGGAVIDGNTPRTDAQLTDTQAHLDQYDAVVFGCAGGPNDRSTGILDRVRTYANKGGRVFATHFEYVYLYTNNNWASTVTWDTANQRYTDSGNAGGSTTSPGTGGYWDAEVNTSPGKRLLFSQWLAAPGVTALQSSTPVPIVRITEARNNADQPVVSPTGEEWMTRRADTGNKAVLHYTFNTPIGAPAANQCGRVLFSDFHVSIGQTAGETFPDHCNTNGGNLTNQEKILAFFLFDLTSCIDPTTPVTPPSCTPLTCAQQGIACGKAGNGCGQEITCAPCPENQVCIANACVTPPCTQVTCEQRGANCGIISNGCGGTRNCGDCTTAGEVCGGSGPNQCGTNSCTPTTCSAQSIQCGPAGNGCGDLLDCGPCPNGQTCGGGGTPGVCGAPNCTPRTCAQANANCGFVANGCGGVVDCGPCPAGQSCGGGGTPNQCGGTSGPK